MAVLTAREVDVCASREFLIPQTEGASDAIDRALAVLALRPGFGEPGRLVFEPGVYHLKRPILVTVPSTWLVGCGTVLAFPPGTPYAVRVASVADCGLSGILVSGDGVGLDLEDVTDFVAIDLRTWGVPVAAVRVRATSGRSSEGIDLQFDQQFYSRHGVVIEAEKGGTICGVNLRGDMQSTNAGPERLLEIRGDVKGVLVEGSTFQAAGHAAGAVFAELGSGVKHVTFAGCCFEAIEARAVESAASHVTFTDCSM
ncbi:MAG: hypothetical protein ACOY3Y_08850, partial [Acidobacteriota bacterium]